MEEPYLFGLERGSPECSRPDVTDPHVLYELAARCDRPFRVHLEREFRPRDDVRIRPRGGEGQGKHD